MVAGGCVLRDGDRNSDLCDRAVLSVREIDEDARSVTRQWGHFPKCYHHGNASRTRRAFDSEIGDSPRGVVRCAGLRTTLPGSVSLKSDCKPHVAFPIIGESGSTLSLPSH